MNTLVWQIIKRDFFSIPNILSYFRLLLVPVFIFFYINSNVKLAAVIFCISALSDIADGFIARKFNLVTDWGKIIDPIADKATQCAVFICLLFKYNQVKYLVYLLVIKEVFLAIMGFVVIKKTDIVTGSRWYGKLNTCVIFGIIMGLLLLDLNKNTVNWLVLIGGICMMFSMISYILKYMKMLKN